MKQPLYKIVLLLIIIGFSSCKKLDYDNGFASFADIFFVNNSVNKNLAVKYNGNPIPWDLGSGRIHTLQGEGSFEFYDKSSNVTLGTKKVNVSAKGLNKFLIFQPSEEAPFSFLDPNGQANEAAPEKGYMKIKIANYAPKLIPFEKIDVVIYGLVDMAYVKIGVIENVGKNLDKEQYHLVSKGAVTAEDPFYQFSFIDHVTKAEVKNFGGGRYASLNLTADAVKGIYTIYLTSQTASKGNSRIKYEEGYYHIGPRVLFSN